MQGKGYSWTQKLDYEKIHFRCRECYETGHLALNCKKLPEKNKERKTQCWWIDANLGHQQIWKDPYLQKKFQWMKTSVNHLIF